MTETQFVTPMDEHNQRLLANVHPPDWQNPTPEGRYNLVVLGAGTAGLVSAAIGASLGARVALVERKLMGGDCLNVGCVPSKAIIRSSRVAADITQAGEFGLRVPGEPEIDFGAVMRRMRRLRSGISPHDSARRFQELGIDVYFGQARFKSAHVVEVEGQALDFKKAIIATGASPFIPPIEGLREADPLTNETIFNLTELPKRLAVLGGGPLGCELAQAMSRLGAKVTLIEMADQIMGREDEDAGELISQVFKREAIDVRVKTKLVGVSKAGDHYHLRLETPDGEASVEAERILAAMGRAPNVGELNLEAAGIEYDPKTGITVDESLQTSQSHIYAAGDVASRYKFTHTADFGARIATQNALFPFLPRKRFSDLVIPWCTYTDPEVAHTGRSESQLKDQGVEYDVIKIELAKVDRAVLDSADGGFLKLLIDPGKGRILGASLIAAHAGEMISEITLAIVQGLSVTKLGEAIHPYPTQAEVFRMAADQFRRRGLTPTRQKLLRWYFSKIR